MNFQFYVEKLFDSEVFRNFQKEFSSAYPCSCFFGLDFENLKNPDNKACIDYYVPELKKMFSFKLEKGVEKLPVESFGEVVPEKLGLNYSFDFEDIENLIRNEMKSREIKEGVQKILISIQRVKDEDFILATVFISRMGLLKVKIGIAEKKILEFEKKSFLDMLKITGKKKD